MTADDDDWITAFEAAELIRARLNVSRGKAQKIFSEAYGCGEVRSTTGDFADGYPGPRVSRSDVENCLTERPAEPISQIHTAQKSEKPPLSQSAIQKWFRENVNPSQPMPYWFAAIRQAHPEHCITREPLRNAWNKLPKSLKRSRGAPARKK